MTQPTMTAKTVNVIQENPAWFTAGLILLTLALLAWVTNTGAKYDTLYFVPVSYDLLVDILTPIFVIALLVERAIEVFVSTGRKLGRADHEKKSNQATAQLTQLKERINVFQAQLDAPGAANLSPAERGAILNHIDAANAEMGAVEKTQRELEAELDLYRSETARITFVAGALLGLIIALTGVRVIAPIIDFKLADWGGFQKFAFHGVDVVLTAALIAGGANGVHQVIGVFADFTESTRKKAKT